MRMCLAALVAGLDRITHVTMLPFQPACARRFQAKQCRGRAGEMRGEAVGLLPDLLAGRAGGLLRGGNDTFGQFRAV